MRLVVGLGNPGRRYAGTRHNVGFHVVERLCARWGIDPQGRSELGSQVTDGSVAGARALLARPQQFMNRSGQPVSSLASFYKLSPERIVVIHDEMGLPPGEIRCREGGGHGGHNGLRDIIAHIGRDFLRVRLGIGRPSDGGDVTEHVLGSWAEDEQALIRSAVEVGCDAVEAILSDGIVAAQNRFNVRPKTGPPPISQSQKPRPDTGALEQS
jgi:PTH1 family peptidyl-tRNA hydrolase